MCKPTRHNTTEMARKITEIGKILEANEGTIHMRDTPEGVVIRNALLEVLKTVAWNYIEASREIYGRD